MKIVCVLFVLIDKLDMECHVHVAMCEQSEIFFYYYGFEKVLILWIKEVCYMIYIMFYCLILLNLIVLYMIRI